MTPDLKVYLTTVSILSTNDWLKPGMSAKVEILVDHLADVVYVPVQAVTPINGKPYCFLANGSKPERREVETGQLNDEFIEIKKGLKQGDVVLLRPLERSKDQKPEETEKPGGSKPEAVPAAPPPSPASAPASRAT
jgi:multidrug efflux pump subunit AcrA (membrane-fusion protein)